MNKKIILVLPLMFGLFACGNKKEDKGELVTKEEFLTQLNAFNNQENVPEYFKYEEAFNDKEKIGSEKYNIANKKTIIRAINGEKLVTEHKNFINKHSGGREFLITFNEEKNHIKRYSINFDDKGVDRAFIIEFDITKDKIDNKDYYSELTEDDYLSNYALKYVKKMNRNCEDEYDFTKNNYYINKKGDTTNFLIEKEWEENNINTGRIGSYKLKSNIKFKTNYIVEYNEISDSKDNKNYKNMHFETKVKCSEFKGNLAPRKNVKYEVINF